MIGYTTVGSNDIPKAAKFYDNVFGIIGAKRCFDHEGFVGWAMKEGEPMFSIVTPHNEEKATSGNGTMIAITVPNAEASQKMYAKAIELGAICEGEPGIRMEAYYCAYVRDLDGNKLNFFCMAEDG